MNKQRYKVICEKCEGHSIVEIVNAGVTMNVLWLDVESVISGRCRMDGYWGWQCRCGNYSIASAQETKAIANLASPKPQEIDEIVRNLERPHVREVDGNISVDGFTLVKV